MKNTVFTAIALVLVGATAQAATVSFSDEFAGRTEFASTGSANPLGATNTTEPLSLSKFDGSLGTLTGVAVTFYTSFDSTADITNTSDATVMARFSEDAEINYSSSISELNGSIVADDQTAFFSLGANATEQFVLDGEESETLSITDDLSRFIAGASDDSQLIEFFSVVSTTFTGGGGNLEAQVATDALFRASITYTYDEVVNQVPLPATLPLALLGVAGLGVVSRRRRG